MKIVDKKTSDEISLVDVDFRRQIVAAIYRGEIVVVTRDSFKEGPYIRVILTADSLFTRNTYSEQYATPEAFVRAHIKKWNFHAFDTPLEFFKWAVLRNEEQ